MWHLMVGDLLEFRRNIRMFVRMYYKYVSNLGIDECFNQ